MALSSNLHYVLAQFKVDNCGKFHLKRKHGALTQAVLCGSGEKHKNKMGCQHKNKLQVLCHKLTSKQTVPK